MKKLSVMALCCLAIFASSLTTLDTVKAQAGPSAVTAFQLQPVVTTGLTSPVFVTNARDGSNRLFIVERGGIIKVLQPGQTTPTEFLNITTRVLSSGGEQGLLGLAFHPQYKINGRFFVYYTRQTDGAIVIAEYHASSADPNVADTTETVILGPIPHPVENNHNGGMIAFGLDGFLYAGTGDGGSGNDPPNNGQNINALLGKVLRIDIDHPNGLVPYSSPPSNPFVGIAGADEIFAYGFRNPWRFSFDRLTGQLYLGDVGQSAREEIDIVTLGGNYGWRIMEGTICNPAFNGGVCTPPSGHIPPIAEYDQAGPRCAITGGYVYRGPISTLPAGTYVYADFCTGEIFSLAGGVQTLLLDTSRLISSFGEDEAGELYVVGLGGTVERIVNPDATCAFFLSSLSQSFPAAAGSGSVTVTTPSVCNWTAVSNDSWITITSGGSGTGVGAVQFSVAANGTGATRSGTITIAGQTFTVFQGLAFTDVAEGSPFYRDIGKLAARGVTLGCNGSNYCPDQVVTREQMAAFIIRALGEFNPPTPAMQRFLDVPPSNPFYNFIDRMAVLNITLGCDANNYCPTASVTREQMAAFLLRAKGEPNPPLPPSQRFNDVPPSNPFYNFIDRMAVLSITLGCSANPPLYCPTGEVTRAQMAAFLVRAFNL